MSWQQRAKGCAAGGTDDEAETYTWQHEVPARSVEEMRMHEEQLFERPTFVLCGATESWRET